MALRGTHVAQSWACAFVRVFARVRESERVSVRACTCM